MTAYTITFTNPSSRRRFSFYAGLGPYQMTVIDPGSEMGDVVLEEGMARMLRSLGLKVTAQPPPLRPPPVPIRRRARVTGFRAKP